MFVNNESLGIQEISCQNLNSALQSESFELIDVRRPDEFTGELGHIEGSRLVTLGPDLETELQALDKETTYIFICRSGGRSATATSYAQELGFKSVYNMIGGMLEWNRLGFPIKY